MAYLIGSNVVINYIAENFDSTVLSRLDIIFDTDFYHSVITTMEVLGFNGDRDVMEQLEKVFEAGKRLDIDDSVVRETIKIRKTVSIKLPDAIIAATAIVHNYELITANTSDLLKVHGLKVTDPQNLI
ncbi:MAG: type II toxin-antitoxin system VapC family toxin [Chitinophagaceae bacterium]|nr:type II toxin-antitoxin system VapC family toxin [Chitinophagaceae bacterium]